MVKLKKEILSLRYLILAVSSVGIFLNIFVSFFRSDLLTAAIFLLWILTVWISKINEEVSLFGGLIFLSLACLTMALKKYILTESLAIWAYLFLFLGVFQCLVNFYYKNRQKVK